MLRESITGEKLMKEPEKTKPIQPNLLRKPKVRTRENL